jgi:HAD superfamily hydrolase (TIGR01509 family)
LILDFDGTVVDTEEPLYRSWAELWAEHGQALTMTEWQNIIGTNGVFDPWAELERRLNRSLDPRLQDRRRARRDALQALQDLRPGVVDWLDASERLGVPVGIASSSSADWVEAHLESLGLRHRFACLVCRDDGIPPKPDPTSYRLACERLGAEPARSVAVEDSPHGVTAAVSAGLFTVAVPHGLTADLDVSSAHVVLDSLDELTLGDALDHARRRTQRRNEEA